VVVLDQVDSRGRSDVDSPTESNKPLFMTSLHFIPTHHSEQYTHLRQAPLRISLLLQMSTTTPILFFRATPFNFGNKNNLI